MRVRLLRRRPGVLLALAAVLPLLLHLRPHLAHEGSRSVAASDGNQRGKQSGRCSRCQEAQQTSAAAIDDQSKRTAQCEASKSSKCKSGCKYLRGQWSSGCGPDGLRVRVDKLVSRLGANRAANNTCQLERRVTKDCRHACHYVKSAWSECLNGFKTRNLTLDTSAWQLESAASPAPDRSTCARDKQVRRACRPRELAKQAALAGKGPSSGPRLKAAQRRRLKQLQRQQQTQSQVQTQQTKPPANRQNKQTNR